MTIQQAYVKFQIMPSLQLHQLRVGAVAKLILEHSPGKLERGEIITACLLHDMGNIIKFDLDLLPQFLLPEGKAYWQGVKTDFIKKYGSDEHEATVKIAKELDVSDKTLVLMSNIGFSKAPSVLEETDPNALVVAYPDTRVGPNGIVSQRERFEQGMSRFIRNKNVAKDKEASFKRRHMELSEACYKIEQKLFAKLPISPGFISDDVVNPLLDPLREFSIK